MRWQATSARPYLQAPADFDLGSGELAKKVLEMRTRKDALQQAGPAGYYSQHHRLPL